MNALAVLALLAVGAAEAATLDVTVRDAGSAPVADAIVYSMQKSGTRPERAPRGASIAQKDKQFAPPVTVVQAGTSVQFPNRDPFRHHVYSFSPTKIFEIKLYAGTPADPVVFDKPGEVVLGCNIHDNMVGYIYVVDTPFFAKTDAQGRARIEGLPPGDFDVIVWHPAQAAAIPARPISAKGEESIPFGATITLRPAPRPPG